MAGRVPRTLEGPALGAVRIPTIAEVASKPCEQARSGSLKVRNHLRSLRLVPSQGLPEPREPAKVWKGVVPIPTVAQVAPRRPRIVALELQCHRLGWCRFKKFVTGVRRRA